MTIEDSKNYIQALPWEILEKIFSHLTSSKLRIFGNYYEMSENTDLKSAILVCKRWNEIISSSHKLMQTFVLQIVDRSINDLEYPVFIRRYRSCEIYKLPESQFDLCFQVLNIYGPNLKVVTLHGIFPEICTKQMSLLSACRNIEELRLFNITENQQTKCSSLTNAYSFDFPHLKSLSIIDRPQNVASTIQILNAFQLIQLESLTIHRRGFFELPIYSEWKIHKLDVGKVFQVQSFIRFLCVQKPYLRELSIHYSTTVLEYIMREMKDLTTLKLYIDVFPGQLITNDLFESNTNLKNLTITYKQIFTGTELCDILLKHYTKIETLNLDFFYGGLAFTTDNYNGIIMKDLKHLSSNSNNNFVFLRGKFPDLQSLHIGNFRRSKNYSFSCLNTLEHLSITISSFEISLLADFYPNLKYLSIKHGADIDQREMFKIITKLPKLEVLKISPYMWRLDETPIDFLASLNHNVLKIIFQNN